MIDPRGMTVLDWTDSMAPVLDRYGVTARLDDPTQWREWGRLICDIPAVRAQAPPEPEMFDDWMMWAMEFDSVSL